MALHDTHQSAHIGHPARTQARNLSPQTSPVPACRGSHATAQAQWGSLHASDPEPAAKHGPAPLSALLATAESACNTRQAAPNPTPARDSWAQRIAPALRHTVRLGRCHLSSAHACDIADQPRPAVIGVNTLNTAQSGGQTCAPQGMTHLPPPTRPCGNSPAPSGPRWWPARSATAHRTHHSGSLSGIAVRDHLHSGGGQTLDTQR